MVSEPRLSPDKLAEIERKDLLEVTCEEIADLLHDLHLAAERAERLERELRNAATALMYPHTDDSDAEQVRLVTLEDIDALLAALSEPTPSEPEEAGE